MRLNRNGQTRLKAWGMGGIAIQLVLLTSSCGENPAPTDPAKPDRNLLPWTPTIVGPGGQVSDQDALIRDLTNLAAIAGPVLDGDECRAVLTERTYKTMWAIDPRDQWAASDNYDYDEEVAIRVKKLLIRLARTRSYRTDCNLWLICPEKPDTVQCVIKQVNNCCPYAPWGVLYQPTPEPMKAALKGKITVGIPSADRVSVFAPIRNSMGDIVGAVECSSRVDFWTERATK